MEEINKREVKTLPKTPLELQLRQGPLETDRKIPKTNIPKDCKMSYTIDCYESYGYHHKEVNGAKE